LDSLIVGERRKERNLWRVTASMLIVPYYFFYLAFLFRGWLSNHRFSINKKGIFTVLSKYFRAIMGEKAHFLSEAIQ